MADSKQNDVNFDDVMVTVFNNGTSFPTRFSLGQIMDRLAEGETRGNFQDATGRNAGHWKLRTDVTKAAEREQVKALDKLYADYLLLLWREEREYFQESYESFLEGHGGEEEDSELTPLPTTEAEVIALGKTDVEGGPRYYALREDFEHYLNHGGKDKAPKNLRHLLQLTAENLR